MISLAFLAASAFLLTALLTPLVRGIALRGGWVDQPDAHRKLHQTAVPRLGGVAVLAGYLGSFALLLAGPLNGGRFVEQHVAVALPVLGPVLLVFTAGVWDDLAGLRPWQKLAAQLAAAGWAYAGGVQLYGFGEWGQGLAGQPLWWSAPLTILWLVVCSNAFNLIDGLDGLASGVGLFATSTLLVAALFAGHITLALVTAPLAGCLLAFLRYNFNPASIFLGDCGSLAIGFLLGCCGIIWSQKTATLLGLAAPVLVFSIPFADVVISVLRRWLRMRPIFAPDHGHIHHRLLALGFSPRRAALALYAFCGAAAAVALLEATDRRELAIGALALFGFFGIGALRALDYPEFSVTWRLIRRGAVRRIVTQEIELESLRRALAHARTPEQCWQLIRNAAREFGADQVWMRLGALDWTARHAGDNPESWQVRIPLARDCWVNFTRRFTQGADAVLLGQFVSTIHDALPPGKLAALGVIAGDPSGFKPLGVVVPASWREALEPVAPPDRSA